MDGFFDELDVLPRQHGLEDRLDDADMAMDWIKEGMLQTWAFSIATERRPPGILWGGPFDAPDDDEEEETNDDEPKFPEKLFPGKVPSTLQPHVTWRLAQKDAQGRRGRSPFSSLKQIEKMLTGKAGNHLLARYMVQHYRPYSSRSSRPFGRPFPSTTSNRLKMPRPRRRVLTPSKRRWSKTKTPQKLSSRP